MKLRRSGPREVVSVVQGPEAITLPGIKVENSLLELADEIGRNLSRKLKYKSKSSEDDHGVE